MAALRVVEVHKGERIRLFNTLAIETSAMCNRSCVFCPNHDNQRPDDLMPMPLIEKMATELHDLKYAGRITNYIYNEPLRDSRALYILRMLHAAVPRACLMVSTNCDYLHSKKDLVALLATGVRQVQLNIYSAADGHPDPARVARGAEAARKRHAQVQGWVDELPNVDQRGSLYTYVPAGRCVVRVERKYGVTQEATRLSAFELQNRSGLIQWFKPATAQPLHKMCVRPFRFLNVNWKGDAILCCNDYHGTANFGNVRSMSLVDVWNAAALHKYRLLLQNKRRDLPLCSTCDYGGGSYPHMVQHVTFGETVDATHLAVRQRV